MTIRATKILYRDFWGTTKRRQLLQSLDQDDLAFEKNYVTLNPTPENRFALRPGDAGDEYGIWPDIKKLASIEAQNGLMEKRGGALMDNDRTILENRLRAYLDKDRSFAEVRPEIGGLANDYSGFDATKVRDAVVTSAYATASDPLDRSQIRRYWLRGYEVLWAYTTTRRPIWNSARPTLQQLLPEAAGFFVTRPAAVAVPEGFISCWTSLLGDNDALRGHAYFFPVLENLSGVQRPNLSDATIRWLAGIELEPTPETSRLVWHHALAITYSPAYLAENAAGIQQGWPRIPLPGDADLLRASAALGERLAALLDPETNVPGLGQGLLASIAIPSTVPGATRDWCLNGWGSRTDKGVTMPGRGKTDLRPYGATEAAAQEQAALLGAQTRDVWMNSASFWKNIPEAVWETHIGGYQVLKKWLSYRDHSIIGRPLTQEEVAHIQATARRLAAILLMGPDLDASYRASAESHIPLPPG